MHLLTKLVLGPMLALPIAVLAAENPKLHAPNVVVISETLVTAGQPDRASLLTLSQQGFQAVVNLAPPTVPDAVTDEASLVRDQGIDYINIPVQWKTPTEADFESFVATMNGFAGKKVLVHCQANMRASAMTFLYRVIVAKDDPAKAFESVEKVWTPEGPWKTLVNEQLHKHEVSFQVL
ncbi:MAG: protein tyrosine phosphatase family protein [Ahniella sp.]|nr:protein tyrosine phosphatase family protein [Ahniella sp.]